ncbi:hypothetical protein I3760_08G106800 [Carya illinoinensis]|nr:hypothetical protein I3760_08G106800 [Carya illinoinensis]
MDIFVQFVVKMAEYTIAPIGQWLGYSFCYNNNVVKMKKWEEKLRRVRNSVQHSIDAAIRNVEEIEDDKVHEGQGEAKMRCSKGVCLKLQHQLSWKAKNLVKVIGEALEKGKFDRISYCLAPKGIVTTRYMDCMEFVSRMLTMKGLKEALGYATIDVIGLWAMSGVGKTTLMREVDRQVKEDKLFDELAWANLDAETTPGRANRLWERLTIKEKMILVILDDIWEKLDLEVVGIDPCKGCKVVLVSRQRDLSSCEMGTQKDFGIEMEADSVKDPNLRFIETKIAKECDGLSIALVTVSKQLRHPNPEHLIRMQSTIYFCIELSFRHLGSQELQYLFLHCADSEFGFNIRLDLLKYYYGLGLFNGINTLEDARNRLYRLLRNLKDSCLLQDFPHNSQFYRMHDVVRDVATCKAFSICGRDIHQLPNELECPKLRFLYVNGRDRSLQIPDTFFQGTEKLKVLDLMAMELSSLPSSLFLLRNLQTLCLDQCELGDISAIGELKNLVILSLIVSDISALPIEIGLLVHLRLFDFLVELEELYMENSFYMLRLTTLGIHIRDACMLLKDLQFEKLERYNILVGNVWDWFDKLEYSRTLKLKLKTSFQSEVGIKMLNRTECLYLDELKGVKMKNCEKLKFVFPSSVAKGLSKLQELHIKECNIMGAIVVKEEGKIEDTDMIFFPQLRLLALEHLPKLMSFLRTKNSFATDVGEIILEGTLVFDMPIPHEHVQHNQHRNLSNLEVQGYCNIKYLLSFSTARFMVHLKYLHILECKSMEEVLVTEEIVAAREITKEVFFQLEYLKLIDLMNLKGFCIGCDIQFLSLENLRIDHFPKLEIIQTNVEERPPTIMQPLFNVEIISSSFLSAFPCLKRLAVHRMDYLKLIWQNQFVKNSFCNLQLVDVELCENLVSNFQSDMLTRFWNVEELFETSCTSLQQLKDLWLAGLPQMKHVWSKDPKAVFSFKNLKQIHASGCENLRSFFLTSIARSLIQLENLKIIDCGIEEIVEGERGEDAIEMFVFPQVPLLTLERLPLFHKALEILVVSECHKLKNFEILNCNRLINLITCPTTKSLVQLRRILRKMIVSSCEGITKIVANEDNQAKVAITFSKFTCLKFDCLPNFTTFCS